MKQQVIDVGQKVITNNNLLFYLSDPNNDLLNYGKEHRRSGIIFKIASEIDYYPVFLFTLQLSYQQY